MGSEAIVGTGSVVGFDVNGDGNHRGTRDLIQMGFRADGFRDVLESIRNEGRDVAHSLSQLSTQVALGDAASQIAIEKTAAAGILEAAKNAAAINLNVEKIAAAAALAASECCCEIKELIREDGGKTRELINSVERDRQAVQLVDAKNEILALRLGAGGNGNGNNVR